MVLSKKSIKWVVAAIVVFVLALTALFATANVVTASAETETQALVVVSVETEGGSGTYPNLVNPSGATWTITAKYYYAMPDEEIAGSGLEFIFSPMLIGPSGSYRPTRIDANEDFNASLTGDDEFIAGTSSAFGMAIDPDEDDTAETYNGIVANAAVEGKHLFTATYVLDGYVAFASGAYSFGTVGAEEFSINDNVDHCVPVLSSETFNLRTPIDVPTAQQIPVPYTGILHNPAEAMYPSDAYSVSGDSYANVNPTADYELTLALVDEASAYCWNDETKSIGEKVIPWNITPRPVSLTFDEESYSSVFGEALNEIAVSVDESGLGLISAGDLGSLSYRVLDGNDNEVDPFEAGTAVGTYYLTTTYSNTNANYAVTLDTATYEIEVLEIDIPEAKEQNYYYSGSDLTFEFEDEPDENYVSVEGDVASTVGEHTVTVSLLDTANTAWKGLTGAAATASRTYPFEIQKCQIHLVVAYRLNGDDDTKVVIGDGYYYAPDSIGETPNFRYFSTQGYKIEGGNGSVVTNLTPEMDGATLIADYTFCVGAGDANGDGFITVTDVLKMRRAILGLDETYLIATVKDAWDYKETNGEYNNVFAAAFDVNGTESFHTNDIVAVREALATGYDYKIISENGRQAVVYQTNRRGVSDLDALISAVQSGYAVILTSDIYAPGEAFDLDLSATPMEADIDLGGYSLTLDAFTLTTSLSGVSLKIANGTLYTFEGISITAPNGNVVVTSVNGYTMQGASVELAAYTSSLHIGGDVAFYTYPQASKSDAIDAVTEIVVIEDAEEKAAAVATFNTTVAKAPVEIPVDTHVVVEEAATLTVQKITVVEASNAQAEVKTFSIDVQSTATETIRVDVSSQIENSDDYIVEAVAIGGATATTKVEIAPAANQTLDQSYGVKTEAELAAAIAKGGDIKLGANISLASAIEVSEDVTIDMNGFSITRNGYVFDIYATLTLTGTGTITANGTTGTTAIYLNGAEDATHINYSVLNLGENVSINTDGWAVVIYNNLITNTGYGAVANIAGTINANVGITVLGNVKQFDGDVVNDEPIDAVAEVNVKGTAVINSGETAIYTAGFAKYNVEAGAYLEGDTALYIKSGYVNVAEGVTLKATMPALAAYKYSGGGFNSTGDAVVIDKCFYPGNNATVAIDENVTYIVTAEGAQNVATYWAVATEAQLREAINAGASYICLRDNITVTGTTVADRLIIANDATLDLNGKTLKSADGLEPTSNWSTLFINNGAVANIKNGTIGSCYDSNGTKEAPYGITVGVGSSAATLNLTAVTVYGGTSAVYVIVGEANIYSGNFAVAPWIHDNVEDYEFLLNCYDDSYVEGTAKISVYGGTFANFNPADCAAEGAHTNFLAEGYAVAADGDTYTVSAIA